MLLLWARVDQRAIAMKGYSAFSQSSIAGISPSDFLVSYLGHLLGEVLPLCRDAVSVCILLPQLIGQEKLRY